MIRRDPGLNMTNPPPVDYLLPGQTTVNNPPGVYGKYYGGSGGSRGYSYPRGSAPAIPAAPKYTAPALGTAPKYEGGEYRGLPTYTAPAWNESAIDALSQKRAAPGLRQLRQQVQRVTGRRFDNPQVGRMTLRDALQGYGSGVSQVIGSASSAASSEYGQKYARTSENARAAYTSRATAISDRNRYREDLARTNYQGTFAQWQAENARSLDEAKLNYGGALSDYEYGQNLKSESEREQRQYALKQRELDDAWNRWKKQQTEMQTLPQRTKPNFALGRA